MSVEGIPNGYRLVRVGRVYHGETWLDNSGLPLKWFCLEPSKLKNYVIIEPIKGSKQYRGPEISDLANGPIEIEACTPDPETGERRWKKRKLVAIDTVARNPFVCRHPNHRVLVCYKEARIEVSASSEASQSKIIPVNVEDIDAFIGLWPREIPPGFMLLHSDSKAEPREIGDCFWCVSRGRWEMIPDEILEKANQQSWTAIRRIPEEPIKIPDGWRELDESDNIEQSDKYDDGNRWMPYTYDPASPKSVRFNKSIHVRHIRKIKEPATDHIADANKMVPPTGYRLLDKSAKVEPRKAGDLFWSLTLVDWKVLSDQSEQDANRDDWPACRKIETANPSEIPSSSEAEPLAIPEGWRELEFGETRLKTDLYSHGGKWNPYTDFDPAESEFPKYDKRIHQQHIRKIETAPQADHIADANKMVPPAGYRLLDKSAKVEPRQVGDLYWSVSKRRYVAIVLDHLPYANRDNWPACRKIEQVPDVKVTIYREPTQQDLANGPIRCRVRDSKESEWEIMNLYAVLPERIEMRFVAIGDADSIATKWKYCEIPSDHQAIRVGDLVRVTARQVGVYRVGWVNEMNRQVNKVAKVSGITHDGRFLLNGCGGWRFHRDWLELVETASEAKGGEA